MVGIVAMLLASIVIRKKLRTAGAQIDFAYTSCADFALFVKGIPRSFTAEKLKQQLEEKFSPVKIVYVNLCYHID